jgi:hypothetical protein
MNETAMQIPINANNMIAGSKINAFTLSGALLFTVR